jgi:hypothetical protein
MSRWRGVADCTKGSGLSSGRRGLREWLLHSLSLPVDDGGFSGRIREANVSTSNLGIVDSVKISKVLLHVADDTGDGSGIDVLVTVEDVSPDGSSKDSISLGQALVVGSEHTTPLHKEIFEVLVAHTASGDVVQGGHAVFGGIGEVIQQVLMPVVGVLLREHPQTYRQEVHVYVGNLSPCVERRGETQLCILESASCSSRAGV